MSVFLGILVLVFSLQSEKRQTSSLTIWVITSLQVIPNLSLLQNFQGLYHCISNCWASPVDNLTTTLKICQNFESFQPNQSPSFMSLLLFIVFLVIQLISMGHLHLSIPLSHVFYFQILSPHYSHVYCLDNLSQPCSRSLFPLTHAIIIASWLSSL